ncbi:MAG: SDR family oxidoreductase [Rhodospirillales bacterium]|nr:SDR family oxidoreductase [Rhodospirillales bacterium]
MKVVIFGATGQCGQRLVKAALAKDHKVTAFVRNREKLLGQLDSKTPKNVIILEGDVMDEAAVAAAIEGHDAVINASGNATVNGKVLENVSRIMVDQTQKVLGKGGRLWLFGGAAALDVPGTRIMGVDLPMVPSIYRTHKTNFEYLSKSGLDWSFLCPGPMNTSPDGKPRTDLRVSIDVWPFKPFAITKFLPRISLSIAFKKHIPEMIVSYEDAAELIINNLSKNGPCSRHRIGLALPKGMRGQKTYLSGV